MRCLELLAEREEVQARGAEIMQMQGLRDWIARETKLSQSTLDAEVARTNDPDLHITAEWSRDVNTAVGNIVHHVPPFPFVRESLEKLTGKADMVVVSATPTEALQREWAEHGVDGFVRVIAGQEMGSKAECIEFAATGRYEPSNILMIGDAPGDMKAARSNNALFYPINPGSEEESWELFHNEAIDRFLGGTYAGEYEDKLIARFNEVLPERAPWQK
jgi:phosphoglycolate phosphatase-like HAD superfamily hydrolase